MRTYIIAASMLLLAGNALAAFSPIGLTIEVQSGDDFGCYQWNLPAHSCGRVPFTTPPGLKIRGRNGDLLATIDQLEIEMDDDPYVSLVFGVTAGDVDTIFTFTSAQVQFEAMACPDAYAMATATLTDNGNDGARLTGLLDDGLLYEATYNQTTWVGLIDSMSADPGMMAIGLGRQPTPPQMWDTINDSVTSIQAEYKFQLSAYDSASGTSRFEVIPEPGVLSLLAAGGLALARRRRR